MLATVITIHPAPKLRRAKGLVADRIVRDPPLLSDVTPRPELQCASNVREFDVSVDDIGCCCQRHLRRCTRLPIEKAAHRVMPPASRMPNGYRTLAKSMAGQS